MACRLLWTKPVYKLILPSQRTQDAIMMSVLGHNDVATSFWCNNDVIITSWGILYTRRAMRNIFRWNLNTNRSVKEIHLNNLQNDSCFKVDHSFLCVGHSECNINEIILFKMNVVIRTKCCCVQNARYWISSDILVSHTFANICHLSLGFLLEMSVVGVAWQATTCCSVHLHRYVGQLIEVARTQLGREPAGRYTTIPGTICGPLVRLSCGGGHELTIFETTRAITVRLAIKWWIWNVKGKINLSHRNSFYYIEI